jgi:predicted PurR-regulated permease PerM
MKTLMALALLLLAANAPAAWKAETTLFDHEGAAIYSSSAHTFKAGYGMLSVNFATNTGCKPTAGLTVNRESKTVAKGQLQSVGSVAVRININSGGKLQEWGAPLAMRTGQYIGGMLVGLAIMVISLYYFLADGPGMVRTIMRLSPLDDKYEEQLIDQFDKISRAVVLATLISAFVQGLLAGVGFYFAGFGPVFLMMALAMLLAMVPFVGAAAVWVPACLWLYFHDGNTTAAVLLAIWGAAVVSMVDNLIKPYVLHGRSNLHPLLALLSVLGGVQALGPIGIFVGPMVVVFFQVVLNMIHGELSEMDGGEKKKVITA